jgi:phosphopantothenoylcysteine decarboxylase / phosphopantothenate---cysteine ligase
MARILLGVSGGIAAYKALELVRLATAAGHSLRVIQTPASRRFVGEASFAALTGAPVLYSEFQPDPARGAFPGQALPDHEPLSHLELVARAELFVIAPASANTIAKLAGGLADNLLCSCALAATCPLLVAPAMNNHMYAHPAVQANLQTLRARGVTVLEPDAGRLASKDEHGVGRLPEPAQLLAACEAALAGVTAARSAGEANPAARSPWAGVRVLVTAGGTREPIDSVRFIGNSSSGRMGFALARAARARGAEVSLLAANVSLPPPSGITPRHVVTAAQLKEACEQEFPACEVLFMAAAVADFKPARPATGKIAKHGCEELSVQLEATADVLAGLAERRRAGQLLIGFAAEHGEQALASAREKLARKHLDAIVVNDISRAGIGFDSEENEVTILAAADGSPAWAGARMLTDGPPVAALHLARASKAEIAERILDAVAALRAPAGTAPGG